MLGRKITHPQYWLGLDQTGKQIFGVPRDHSAGACQIDTVWRGLTGTWIGAALHKLGI